MISRQQIVARLREANYTYDCRGKRVEIWRQRGGVQRVNVPMRDYFTEKEAAVILASSGLTVQQIEAFLGACVH